MAVTLSHSSPTRQQPKRSVGLPARFTGDEIELRSPLSLATHDLDPPQPPAAPATPTTSPLQSANSPTEMRVARTIEQAGYDSATTSAYKRRQYKKNPKRQTKADSLRAQAAAEALKKAQFAYLDDLLVFAGLREAEVIREFNQAQSRIYERRTRPADWEITGRRGCPPRPNVWERKIKKQAWEDTPTAKLFNSVLVYTEADDFSTSEDEPDEPQTPLTSFSTKISTPASSHTTSNPSSPVSLLDLAAPFPRAILSILFSDCIAKFHTPFWYSNARLILRLSFQEEDWLEAKYLGFPNADALATAMWMPDAPVWHAKAVMEHRLYRRMKLEHDPAPVLEWLDDEQSTREEAKVDVGMRDVQLAERYLQQRGFKEATIKKFDLEAYVNVGNDLEDDDHDDGGDGDGSSAVADGVQDEVVETAEMEDVVMVDADADANANGDAIAKPSPASDEAI